MRLLLAQNPGPVAHTNPNALAPVPQGLPVGLPSRLLKRRPDILQAEQLLIAANARIGVARPQFFPQLSITASGGVGGSDFASIFDPEGRLIYGIGSLTQPIFQGGLSAEKLRLLAACSFLTGDIQGASRSAAALEALQPQSLEALYWSIQANERLAFQSLARFQQLEPDSARSHVLLGDIYHQLERHDDAQAEYLKALAIAPGDPAAMLGLASAYLSNNNIQGAQETAQSALTHSPEDPELNLILAEVRLSQNAFAEAEHYLKLSLHAKPQMDPHVHALLGKAYAEMDRTNEAIEELKMGASSDEDGAIQYLLARLYRKLGDTKDASAALDRMKTIKQQRSERGVKRVEDPDLSSLEYPPGGVPAS